MLNYSKFRKWSLIIAETIDAWRIIPRLMLGAYGILVFNLYEWYKSIPTYIQHKCDPATLKIFIDAGIKLNDAKSLACNVVDVIGGPTANQSIMVTTIIGLSAGIFGLYTATGKKWSDVDFLKAVPIFRKSSKNNQENDAN
jgi:hypothetical protein